MTKRVDTSRHLPGAAKASRRVTRKVSGGAARRTVERATGKVATRRAGSASRALR